ncbi:predicted protein [Naegleria gruberi]|uniref:Predicted protein n=1 Tax=Naegleria gruberi TaxID=5762 RepID=D2VTY6_NAEGR|nr:uncharacterized protein NAEGRDRAFT_72474 [Naegleria gruberi]EFC39802.1 predicted protein [Naegleria gruberi]|eukprot:XP_002672546.1 predicted protein [Naegleria gruberi strain NEG-M]
MSSFLLSNVMKAALALTNGTNLLSNDDNLEPINDLSFNNSSTLFDDTPDSLFFPNGIPKVPKSTSIEHDRDMYIKSILTEGEITNSAHLPFQLVIPMMMKPLNTKKKGNIPQQEYYSHEELNDISDEERKKRQALLDKYD